MQKNKFPFPVPNSFLIIRLVVAIYLALGISPAYAQSPDWLWAKGESGLTNASGTSIAINAGGDVFATGNFSSKELIFGSTILTNLDSSSSTSDIFLVKYNSAGNVLWAKRFGGLLADTSSGIAIDTSGNILITGYFHSPTITFGSATLTNTGDADIFVVKCGPAGNVLWARSSWGTNSDKATGIVTGTDASVYLTGNFSSPVITFGGTTLTNSGASDIFIAKYDNSGNELWAKRSGGVSNDEGSGITIDKNYNIYITGGFESSTIAFGSIFLTNAISNNTSDIFVVKYDTTGHEIWAINAGGIYSDYGTAITTDTSGNVYITGSFMSQQISFGSTTLTNSSTGTRDIFIVKYDSAGNVIRAQKEGGPGHDVGTGITVGANGSVYVTGLFMSDSILFHSTLVINSDVSGNTTDIFMLKYSNTGALVWAYGSGGSDNDISHSITTDAGGYLYLIGEFKSYTFDAYAIGSSRSTILTNPGVSNLFVLKYSTFHNFIWANGDELKGNNSCQGITTDSGGNVYVTGSFASKSITLGDTTLINAGNKDAFVVKYNAAGNVLWAKRIGGTLEETGNGIATDARGNVYVAGNFNSLTITDGSTTLWNYWGGLPSDIFIIKYDSAGNFRWARRPIVWEDTHVTDIAIDALGNVYLTGDFHHNIDFGFSNIYLHSQGLEMFVVKYDSSGTVLWAKTGGGQSSSSGHNVATDVNGNVYVTGNFRHDAQFGPVSLTNTYSGTSDIFIVKYDGTGNVLWAKSAGGTRFDEGWGCSTDAIGNVFVTGGFSSPTITFGGITLTNATVVHDHYDFFITKYDATGHPLWSKGAGGVGNEKGYGITTDAEGNACVTGSFSSSTVAFDGAVLKNNSTTHFNSILSDTNDIFVAKYDTAGNIIWAKSAGGLLGDYGTNIVADASDNIYTTGYFSSPSIGFGDDTLKRFYNLDYAYSKPDFFVTKLKGCNAYYTIYPGTIPHNWISVNRANGAPPITYTWNWGDNTSSTGMIPSHTYANPGYYDICLTISDAHGCTDTYCDSATHLSTMVSVNVTTPLSTDAFIVNENQPVVFPNPSTGYVNISGDSEIDEIKITTMLGQLVFQVKPHARNFSMYLNRAGIYFIQITTAKNTVIKKLVVCDY